LKSNDLQTYNFYLQGAFISLTFLSPTSLICATDKTCFLSILSLSSSNTFHPSILTFLYSIHSHFIMVRSLKVMGFAALTLLAGGVSAFAPLSTPSVSVSSSPRVVPARDSVIMRAATIEKETVTTIGSPAVLDRSPTRKEGQAGRDSWEVRIYNDSSNTREHVARSLVQVTGMSEISAYQTMMQAHQNGIAVVGRWAYEVAEMYYERLRKNGIVCDIVPVDEDC
jgi:ATP-dependent Clp protease adaptor protein ClpS